VLQNLPALHWRGFAPPNHPTKGHRAFGNRYLVLGGEAFPGTHARAVRIVSPIMASASVRGAK